MRGALARVCLPAGSVIFSCLYRIMAGFSILYKDDENLGPFDMSSVNFISSSWRFCMALSEMRPTNDFETLTKDPKLVFQFVKDKISSVNGDKYVNITDFSPWELKHMVGAFAENLRSMVCLSQPTRV